MQYANTILEQLRQAKIKAEFDLRVGQDAMAEHVLDRLTKGDYVTAEQRGIQLRLMQYAITQLLKLPYDTTRGPFIGLWSDVQACLSDFVLPDSSVSNGLTHRA